MSEFCAAVLGELGEPDGAVTVAFVGRRAIRSLNARYRGRVAPTDVLSFPYPGERAEGMAYLGDIVIAPDVAEDNAEERGGSVEAEMRRLLVHGVLHLVGYDHETDSGEMLRLQGNLLRRRSLAGTPLLRPAAPDGEFRR